MISIIDIYIVRRYMVWLGIVAAILGSVIFLADFAEMLRFASKTSKSIGDALYYSGLRFPILVLDFAPFIFLFSTMFCLFRLSESQELVAVRGGGVSIWRILAPFMVVALTIGIVLLAFVEPLGVRNYRQFNKIEHPPKQNFSLAENGIWLRDETNDGRFIIHANEFIDQKNNLFGNVRVFKFDSAGKFIYSLHAQRGQLKDGAWQLQQVTQLKNGKAPIAIAAMRLPTHLTQENFDYNFHNPRTLNLRQLADYIALGERTGLNVTPYKIRYHSLLSSPFLLIVMVLIAACFALPTGRNHKIAPMLGLVVLSGFAIFLADNFFKLLSMQGLLLPIIASWITQIIAALLAISLLLRLEDG
ncbi:MAG: LPS export ABC transporter permease LptG [Parvibaculales bacterium]